MNVKFMNIFINHFNSSIDVELRKGIQLDTVFVVCCCYVAHSLSLSLLSIAPSEDYKYFTLI